MAKNSVASAAEDNERKYRAPALEKGLDILELLARQGAPMTTSQIASGLGRSVSELFRMVLTLEARGFIAQSDDRDGYILTNKLFSLGVAQAPTKNLIELALPVMKELSWEIGQSCHLVVPSGSQIVVVARIESPRDLGFSVRVGYRRRMVEATSGRILFGFQADDIRNAWLPELKESAGGGDLRPFIEGADKAREQGYVRSPSDFVAGVTDLSAPILGGQGALASLTVPYVECTPVVSDVDGALRHLRQAAQRISRQVQEQFT